MYPNDSRFWQYKVYADIRGGSQDLYVNFPYILCLRPCITHTRTSRFFVIKFNCFVYVILCDSLSTNTAAEGSEVRD